MDITQENAVRADERHRLSDLLEEHADTIGAFAASPAAAVRIVVLLLEVGA